MDASQLQLVSYRQLPRGDFARLETARRRQRLPKGVGGQRAPGKSGGGGRYSSVVLIARSAWNVNYVQSGVADGQGGRAKRNARKLLAAAVSIPLLF
eukprot:COSAG05_NODE_226_length_13453_cov_12.522315_9_plen_97_part_00